MSIFTVIDYSATVRDASNEKYIVVPGDVEKIKKLNPYHDNVDGITSMAFNRYFKWRFNRGIVITMSEDFDSFRKYSFDEINECIEDILTKYNVHKCTDLAILNVVPYQIYKQAVMEIEADNSANMFRRWGFADLGCIVNDYIRFKKYTQILFNNIGSSVIVENFNGFW